jgi:L-amino acid N-acyltransferase YncA
VGGGNRDGDLLVLPMEYTIDLLRPSDWEQVRNIYLEGIATRNATFDVDAQGWDKWDSSYLAPGRLVARGLGGILGWAALSPVSARLCYSGVAEASVYVAAAHAGHGIGTSLLRAVIEASEQAGFWTLQAGIFSENRASRALVAKFGFREVGRRERIGQLATVWRDVLLFERRSKVVGRS